MPMLNLPTNKNELAEVVRVMLRKGVEIRNVHRIEWLITRYYMAGARNFSAIDYRTGTLRADFRNSRGEIDYKYDQTLRCFLDEMGRRLKVDISPSIKRDGDFSLDAIRNQSISQAALNTLAADLNLDMLKYNTLEQQMMYGTVGVASWGQNSVRLERTQAVVEVVPCWQLLACPASPSTSADVQAIMRYRVVPVAWLKEKANLKWPKDTDKMKTFKVKYGDNAETIAGEIASNESYGVAAAADMVIPQGGDEPMVDPEKIRVEYVELVELFNSDYDGTLIDYVVWAGGVVLRHDNWKDDKERPMKPIEVIRDIPTGGFYGKAFMSLIIPTNIQTEYLIKRMFTNAQELDLFGILFFPTSSGLNINSLKPKKEGEPRVLMYEPDLTVPQHQPFSIKPENMGDWPGKVAQMGMQIIKDLSGQSVMMQGDAPGRVDSAQGLGMLYETSTIPLAAPMLSLANGFCTVYKALLGMAREQWEKGTLAKITMLDDTLVGVVLDGKTGKISLDKNSIPHPTQVVVLVKSQMPRSIAQRKSELVQMLQMGLVTPREFRRINMIEGLDFPMGSRAEYENWRKAVLNNIIQFGDGETPGMVIISTEADNPEIQLEAVQDFMAKPEFTLASTAVRQAFEQRKQTYTQLLGGFPQQMPYAEQSAEMADQQQPPRQPGQQGGMPPGMGGRQMQ